MFKRGRLLHRDRIYSDEGFFVIPGRDGLIYAEGGRRMAITVEAGSHGFAIYQDTIGRWNDSPLGSVSDSDRKRIGDNIRRALESQGESVTFI